MPKKENGNLNNEEIKEQEISEEAITKEAQQEVEESSEEKEFEISEQTANAEVNEENGEDVQADVSDEVAENVIKFDQVEAYNLKDTESEVTNIEENINLKTIIEGPSGKEGKRWFVVIIREGWSKNGRYYPKEVLLESYKKFENAPVAVYGKSSDVGKKDFNHLNPADRKKMPGRSAMANTIGFLDEVTTRVTRNGLEVVGYFNVINEEWKTTLKNLWEFDKKDFIGLSIDASAIISHYPQIIDGQKGFVVEKIVYPNEVTVVDRPAAWGRFEDIAASEEENNLRGVKMNLRKLRKALASFLPTAETAETQLMVETALENLTLTGEVRDAVDQFIVLENYDSAALLINAFIKEDVKEEKVEVVKEEKETAFDVDKLVEQRTNEMMNAFKAEFEAKMKAETQKVFCSNLLESKLSQSKLNNKFKSMIKAKYQGSIFSEEDLDNDISELTEAVAHEFEQHPEFRQVIGDTRIVDSSSAVDKVEAMMAMAFGYEPEKDENLSESERKVYASVKPSLQKAYKIWTGDHDLTFRNEDIGGLNTLQESTRSNLSYSIANTMGRAMLQKYEQHPNFWRNLVKINPNVTNFKTQTRVILNGIGSVQPVSETDSNTSKYPNTGIPFEMAETYTVSGYGSMTQITREMIIDDDMGTLSILAGEIARQHDAKLHEFVFGLLTGARGNGSDGTVNSAELVSDGLSIFHAFHNNTGTEAFDHDALNNAITAMGNQYIYGQRAILGTALNDTTTTTVVLNSTGGGAANFSSGTAGLAANDYIQIGSEIMKIVTVDSATQLTVLRGQLGTTATTHTTVNSTSSAAAWVYQLVAPLNLMSFNLVYPWELRDNVFRVLKSANVSGLSVNDKNMFMDLAGSLITPVMVPRKYLLDPNNWYLFSKPAERAVVELAFLFNKQTPYLWTQNDPTVGNVFLMDNIRIKSLLEYGGCFLDPKSAYASIVA